MISFLNQLPASVSLRHGTAAAFGRYWRIDYALMSCDCPLAERVIITSIKLLPDTEIASYCVGDSEAAAVFDLIIDYMLGHTDKTIRCLLEGTEFQKRVWRALADIEVGTTETYSSLAARVGYPKAVRAVGSAVGHNPLSLLLPCHRIVPVSSRLWPGNYAWGKLLKQLLLDTEGAQQK